MFCEVCHKQKLCVRVLVSLFKINSPILPRWSILWKLDVAPSKNSITLLYIACSVYIFVGFPFDLGWISSYIAIYFSFISTLVTYVPILLLQCSNGHTICSGCKPRVHNRCPTCRYELGNIRCLALEKVAASLELPCKYQGFGCMGIYPYYSKLKHESQCAFRPYNCPYAGSECSVMGDIPYLVAHLKDDHKVDMHNGSTFNHRYVKSNPQEVENATWMLTVLFCWTTFSLLSIDLANSQLVLSRLCDFGACLDVHVFISICVWITLFCV